MINGPVYRLLVSEPDEGMPGGVLRIGYLALLPTVEEAISAVLKRCDRIGEISIVGEGGVHLAHAQRLGLRDGDVSAV